MGKHCVYRGWSTLQVALRPIPDDCAQWQPGGGGFDLPARTTPSPSAQAPGCSP